MRYNMKKLTYEEMEYALQFEKNLRDKRIHYAQFQALQIMKEISDEINKLIGWVDGSINDEIIGTLHRTALRKIKEYEKNIKTK